MNTYTYTEIRWDPPREDHEHLWFYDEVADKNCCMACWCDAEEPCDVVR